MTADDRRYTKTHEWVKVEGEEAVIGITDYAQDALGDITFVELPEVGVRVQPREEVGVIESVKAASDIYAPISGEILAVNTELESAPERVNEDPLGKGWLFKMTDFDLDEIEELLRADRYDAMVEEEDDDE